MLGKTIIIMGKSILHKTCKREQIREKWRDGERMRGFALLRTNAFTYDSSQPMRAAVPPANAGRRAASQRVTNDGS